MQLKSSHLHEIESCSAVRCVSIKKKKKAEEITLKKKSTECLLFFMDHGSWIQKNHDPTAVEILLFF